MQETTVGDWKKAYRMKAYRMELKKSAREMSKGDFNINELPEKKRGRPLLLGEELDKQVRTGLHESRADPIMFVYYALQHC